MNYLQKYFKYKKKYLYLKKIIGGNLFNDLYDKLIHIFKDINKKQIQQLKKNILHIKGGSSIKYHLKKKDIRIDELETLTNDIDVYIILDDNQLNKENFLKKKRILYL